MIAGSYYHGDWGAGRIPTTLLDDPGGLRRYLELFNIRYVVADATDHTWWTRLPTIPWLRLRTELQDLAVYETDVAPGYLLGGDGSVAFDYNTLAVRLREPTDELILKFRWVDGLRAHPALPLEPVEVSPGVQFIRARPGRILEFEVRY